MKRKYIKGVPVLLALMIISSNSALAEDAPIEVSAHQTSVPQARSDEDWGKLKDNVVEWSEIEALVHEFNPTVSDLWVTFNQDDKAGKYTTNYESVVSMIDDNYESSVNSAATEVLEALTELQYATSYEETSLDRQAQSTDRAAALLSIGKTEKSVTETIRQSIISMYKAELQQQIDQLTAVYDESLYNSALTKLGAGIMTETDVLSAKETMEKARLTLTQDEDNALKSKQLLNINLGYERNSDVMYPEVPMVSEEMFMAINPDQDAETAIANNYAIKINHRKLEVSSAESSKSSLNATIESEQENVRADITGRYNTLKQAKNSYEQAVLSESNTLNEQAKVQRNYVAGNASLRELEKADYQAQTASLSTQLAQYKYASSYYDYTAAVAGLASADQ